MKKNDVPLTVWISVVILGLLGISTSAFLFSYELGYCYQSSTLHPPLTFIGAVLVYSVLPLLASVDMLRRRTAGRHVAILLLLFMSTRSFRFVVDTVSSLPSSRHATFLFVMFVFSASFFMASLALSLGFNKKVNAYFSSDSFV